MSTEKKNSLLETGVTILVVDDDAAIRHLLAQTLTLKGGYTVFSASNGEEAIFILENATHEFDVVLLDLFMPGLDGLETCSRLRQIVSRYDLLIMIMTAQLQLTDIELERLLNAGADSYIGKPFDLTTLLVNIGLMLRTREQHRRIMNLQLSLQREKAILEGVSMTALSAAHHLAQPLQVITSILDLAHEDKPIDPDDLLLISEALGSVRGIQRDLLRVLVDNTFSTVEVPGVHGPQKILELRSSPVMIDIELPTERFATLFFRFLRLFRPPVYEFTLRSVSQCLIDFALVESNGSWGSVILSPDHHRAPFFFSTAVPNVEISKERIIEILNKGVAGLAFNSGKVMIVDNTGTDTRWLPSSGGNVTPGTILATPLIYNGQTIGVLNLLHHSVGMFNQLDNNLPLIISEVGGLLLNLVFACSL